MLANLPRTSQPAASDAPSARLLAAKSAYTTRRVPRHALAGLSVAGTPPSAGDLVLARVTQLGRHEHLELTTGRRCQLFPGDEILVVFGNRYAPDQFEAVVPARLEACHLVAAGGIAATALSWHANIRGATAIEPIGYVTDTRGARVNLSQYRLPATAAPMARPYTLAVVGTSMNAGKTTTLAHLAKGAVHAGLRVAAGKATGTGAGGDTWLMADAGAQTVLDFSDLGLASTYLAPLPALERVLDEMVQHLGASGAQLILLELADGLYQQETAALLTSPVFARCVDGVMFAAADAMGAAAGVAWLQAQQLPVVGVTGTLTRSPLARREAQHATRLPVLTLADLAAADLMPRLMQTAASVAQAG